jgi:hypothetical protein
MTDQERDFEALGRYVDARERMNKLDMQRHNLAAQISKLLSKATLYDGSVDANTVNRFDHTAFLAKIEELVQINIELEDAIVDVNRHALPAGKSQIRRL